MKKYSRQREAIYRALCSTKTHPSAEWVYAQLKPEMPELSLATVYRNMRFFVEEGIAVRVGVVNGHERFDGDTKPHAHFVCDCCGAVQDLSCSMESALEQAAAEELGAQVTRHELIFRGRCRQCCYSQAEA